ncbi:unnamed protein product [Allacma fusca]
MVKDT